MKDSLLVLSLLVVVIAGYLLPTIIAYTRRHKLRRTILIMNVGFGWTVIGYGLALGLSFTDHTENSRPSRTWRYESKIGLIVCPACDEEVSEEAGTCPNCGQPIKGEIT